MSERTRPTRYTTNGTETAVPSLTSAATMDSTTNSISFAAVLQQATGKQATGIVVPPEVIDRLGAGKKPPVRVTINGHAYRTTIGVMAGSAMIPVSAATRTAANVHAGDPVNVELAVDTRPRTVEIPADLSEAFTANPAAKAFFDTLSNSLQRYHVDNINAAKAADTRQRRLDKTIGLFLDHKQR